MVLVVQSAGGGSASGSTEQTEQPPVLPQRAGSIRIRDLADLYMRCYSGRDETRVQRLSWWVVRLGDMALQDVSDDEVHAALDALEQQPARYFAGNDVDGRPIFRGKRQRMAPATVNRYGAAFAALMTWAIKKRIAPRGFIHPCRSVERRAENNEKTRFLSDIEREHLLAACKASSWPRLYALVLMALTTGARKGELQGLTWADIDRERGLAYVGRSKNGDPRVLPIVPAVLEELGRFAGAPADRVFPSTRRPQQAYAFEEPWKKAMRAAKVKAFTFHDLRHSCASLLARSGASLLEIGDLLGHRQIAMTKRYSHLATGHKSALVQRVLGGIK